MIATGNHLDFDSLRDAPPRRRTIKTVQLITANPIAISIKGYSSMIDT